MHPLASTTISLSSSLRLKRCDLSLHSVRTLTQLQGNVEYKLKLLNPSPERFARLVTQLKWRLLEGGGQAYYELGVADSGLLVGLSRLHLEQSLQTLEEMAGEIGASVVVVKEVEVPAALLSLATAATLGQRRPSDGASRMPRRVICYSSESVTEGESTTTEAELSTPDTDDADLDMDTFMDLPPPITTSFLLRSNPARPSAHSFPSLFPIDSDADADTELDREPLSIDLEIASVFKPRPVRKRSPMLTHGNFKPAAGSTPLDIIPHSGVQTKFTPRGTLSRNKKQHRAHIADPDITTDTTRRGTRDRRRAEKKRMAKLLAAADEGPAEEALLEIEKPESSISDDKVAAVLVPGLNALHVSVDNSAHIPPIPFLLSSNPELADAISKPEERRLIVEALVVRKMSLEEAFLDFGGFALEI